jgi:hypothetical protein
MFDELDAYLYIPSGPLRVFIKNKGIVLRLVIKGKASLHLYP